MSAMSQQERKMKVVLRIHKFSFLQFFHPFILMIRLKHRGACLHLVQIILINLIDVDPAHTVIRLVGNFIEKNIFNLIFTLHLKENTLFQIENSIFLLKLLN